MHWWSSSKWDEAERAWFSEMSCNHLVLYNSLATEITTDITRNSSVSGKSMQWSGASWQAAAYAGKHFCTTCASVQIAFSFSISTALCFGLASTFWLLPPDFDDDDFDEAVTVPPARRLCFSAGGFFAVSIGWISAPFDTTNDTAHCNSSIPIHIFDNFSQLLLLFFLPLVLRSQGSLKID